MNKITVLLIILVLAALQLAASPAIRRKSKGINPINMLETRPEHQQANTSGADILDKFPGENDVKHHKATQIIIPETDMSVFRMFSSAINIENYLEVKYSGDGEGLSLPLEWTNVPEGTKYFALNLWHLPHPEDNTDCKSYWVVYNIPANVTSLPENVQNIGIVGYNDKDRTDYDPMKSKGPGAKLYNITLYALSEKPVFATNKVYREDLLKAIEGSIIEECTLQYFYERKLELNRSDQ